MKQSDIPVKFRQPFGKNAAGGNITTPVPNTTATPGRASLDIGFPPINFTPVASGGIPPFGQDVNGAFNQVSAWAQWLNAGGPVQYDATFSGWIGGYPNGTVLSSNPLGSYWRSTVDDNATNPDAAGTGWVNITSGLAPLASPNFTGAPTAPTQTPGNNSTRLATTAFLQAALTALFSGSSIAANGYLMIGGLTIQWGQGGASPGSVVFPTAFSTACYAVNITPLTTTVANYGSLVTALSTTGFSFDFTGVDAMMWMAVGK